MYTKHTVPATWKQCDKTATCSSRPRLGTSLARCWTPCLSLLVLQWSHLQRKALQYCTMLLCLCTCMISSSHIQLNDTDLTNVHTTFFYCTNMSSFIVSISLQTIGRTCTDIVDRIGSYNINASVLVQGFCHHGGCSLGQKLLAGWCDLSCSLAVCCGFLESTAGARNSALRSRADFVKELYPRKSPQNESWSCSQPWLTLDSGPQVVAAVAAAASFLVTHAQLYAKDGWDWVVGETPHPQKHKDVQYSSRVCDLRTIMIVYKW